MKPLRPIPPPALVERVQSDLAAVEEVLVARLTSDVQVVHQVLGHTLSSGGKRLRPALLLTAARAAGVTDLTRPKLLAAVLEMIHMATLIHDDVIDDADLRRGRPTAARVFGNTPAILSGDVLLARAMALLAEDGDLEIIRLVSQVVILLAEGEAREVEVRGDFYLTEETHLSILDQKTGSLVQLCCELGAMAGRADMQVREALATYGHHLGLAFQIADDLLDYRGNPAVTGKPRATDFVEGCATLPLILLRERLSTAECEFAANHFGQPLRDQELAVILDWMESRGAFALAEDTARKHVGLARSAIRQLPESEERDFMDSFADYVLLREK